MERTSRESVPLALTETSIRTWILAKASELEDSARATLLVEHESTLRGDTAHRTEGTKRLGEYFKNAYTEPIGRGEVPHELLDAKAVLRARRSEIAETQKISFSDNDVFSALEPAEIPTDLQQLLEHILRYASPAGGCWREGSAEPDYRRSAIGQARKG